MLLTHLQFESLDMKNNTVLLKEYGSFNPDSHIFIFTHIPKCGGTSIHKMLNEILEGKYVYVEPNQNTGNISDELKKQLKLAVGAGGHQGFQKNPIIHHQSMNKNRVYSITVREPYERYLSFYRHVQSRPRHYLRKKYPDLSEMNPIQLANCMLEDNNVEISNHMTKMLVGLEHSKPTSDAAINILENNYSIITTMEHIDYFIFVISKIVGRPLPDMATLNTTKNKNSNLSQNNLIELKKLIYSINLEDNRLYEYARQRSIKGMLSI